MSAPMICCVASVAIALFTALGSAQARADTKTQHSEDAQDFVHGAPSEPSEEWTLAAGGRIYDNWWDALDRKEPSGTHPSYPSSAKQAGKATWRCKECHGWDYKGRDGRYATGSHATGIKGIDGAKGRETAEIVALLRAPVHGYGADLMSDDEIARVAAFVSRGQHDMADAVDGNGRPRGDAARGKAVFQTICAACHGFDGRLLNWGTKDEPAYIGTEASKLPDEVLHKIRNSHPGAAMVNLRVLPLADAVDVLTYAATLPVK